MGFMDETEKWILWQEGDGPDPNGEGGCLFNLGCMAVIIVIFLLVLMA